MDIKQFKTIFDDTFKQYLSTKIAQSQDLLGATEIASYFDYVDTFVFSGGKRIRPYCTWLTYKGLGGQSEDILHFSMVFELLHTMALVHDDIIDQAEKRHNVATVHTHVLQQIGNKQVAESQALLIGDIMLARVYELLYHPYDFSEPTLDAARKNVHAMIEEVILGQMIDVQMMAGLSTSKEMIEKKNKYKTSSYTFTRPMLTGAILAGVDHAQLLYIKELGDALGIAFQIKDDLMDIMCGDTTKSLFSDIQEGQQTYFTQYIKEHGSPKDQQLLTDCMGHSLDQDQIEALQEMFTRTNAIDAGIAEIHEYTKKAKALLDKIVFQDTMAYQGVVHIIAKIEQL